MSTAVRWRTDLRSGRYGEVCLAYLREDPRLELSNSYLSNECPDDPWGQLDTARIALAHHATLAVRNGPRTGSSTVRQRRRRRTERWCFRGHRPGRVATLEVGAALDQSFYPERRVHRGARGHYDAATTVSQLRAPDGRAFVT